MSELPPIRARERETILAALRAGVVPRSGLAHIAVGREPEIAAAIGDLARISGGGSAFRLVAGDYGSGKTFLLGLVRSIAHERKLVTMHADLSPDRRLHASDGKARALYAELARNVATRAKPEGGAMAAVVERFATSAQEVARETGRPVGELIAERLAELAGLTNGYDFAGVVGAYWEARERGDERRLEAAVRWLRGEYATRTDARHALGVRTIIDDRTLWDSLKLFATFTRLAGFGGLLITLDELVNLYKLASPQARGANYEELLRLLNDLLQGSASGIGVYLGGTHELLDDPRRGLASYPALASRLAANPYARDGLIDRSGPVIRLESLRREDLYLLLERLRRVWEAGEEPRLSLPDAALATFMTEAERRVGDAYFRTPRTTVRAFLDLCAVLEQNPGTTWESLVASMALAPDREPSPLDDGTPGADYLANFRL